MIHANNTIVIQELIKALEPVIRRIIREELDAAIGRQADKFYLKPDMPLYDDILEIKARKDNDELRFMSHKEVWGE